MPTERIWMSMILLESASKIAHPKAKIKQGTISVIPFSDTLDRSTHARFINTALPSETRIISPLK
jgi:hypothetical protein